MSRVPRIRFKGFEEDWEQRKLGEIGNTYSGLSGKTKYDFGHGQASFITYMNVYSNPVSRCDMVEPIEIDNRQNEVEIGDVFFTTSSETPEEVGMTSVLTEKKGIIYLNSFCFGFRPFKKIDKYYLAYMLRSKNTREKIILLAQGISRYNISKNKVMEISVELPSFEEQILIGKKFKLIDHLITLHQRKLEKLKIIKKSMLENLFPQNGEKTPKIRFSEFTNDWEQRKLGEIAIFNPKSKLPSTFEYVDLESVIGTEMVSHSTETISTAPSRAQRLAKKGDIFYQTVRPYQKNNYLFEKDERNYVFSTGYAQLRPSVNERFLFYLTQNGNFVNMVLYNCTGTSYPAINSSDMRRIDIYLSRNSTEQKCIGNTIKTIDHLITLHQSKLEKLQKIKKSMLESMFV